VESSIALQTCKTVVRARPALGIGRWPVHLETRDDGREEWESWHPTLPDQRDHRGRRHIMERGLHLGVSGR